MRGEANVVVVVVSPARVIAYVWRDAKLRNCETSSLAAARTCRRGQVAGSQRAVGRPPPVAQAEMVQRRGGVGGQSRAGMGLRLCWRARITRRLTKRQWKSSRCRARFVSVPLTTHKSSLVRARLDWSYWNRLRSWRRVDFGHCGGTERAESQYSRYRRRDGDFSCSSAFVGASASRRCRTIQWG